MRTRPVLSLLTLSLIVGLVAPVAAKGTAGRPGERVERQEYLGGGIAGSLYLNAHGQFNTGAIRLAGSRHRFLSAEISDISTGPVLGEVAQGTDAEGRPIVIHRFCGKTDKPVRITPNVQVLLFVNNGTCGSGTSVVTAGEVEVRFTTARR